MADKTILNVIFLNISRGCKDIFFILHYSTKKFAEQMCIIKFLLNSQTKNCTTNQLFSKGIQFFGVLVKSGHKLPCTLGRIVLPKSSR